VRPESEAKEDDMPDTAETTQDDVFQAYQNLYELMDKAYWTASTIQDKDRIRGIEDAISDILTALNAADIKARTQDYADCKNLVDATNHRLDKLKSQIDSIIHVVKIATQVVKAAEDAVKLAAKFFV